MKTAYPTSSDLSSRLTELGFDAEHIAALDLSYYATVGQQRFERATQRVFLSDTNVERSYVPPGNADHLLWIGDLASYTTVNYQSTPTSTATTLTVNEDFELLPLDAPDRSEPWRFVRFLECYPHPRNQPPTPRYYITGKWAWGTSSTGFPEDAWEAMLLASLITIVPIIGNRIVGPVTSWRQADVAKNFGDAPYNAVREALRDVYMHTVTKYTATRPITC